MSSPYQSKAPECKLAGQQAKNIKCLIINFKDGNKKTTNNYRILNTKRGSR